MKPLVNKSKTLEVLNNFRKTDKKISRYILKDMEGNLGIKCCSRCDEIQPIDKFVKRLNVCKSCYNKKNREKYKGIVLSDNETKSCNICNETKSLSCFLKKRKVCRECHNEKRCKAKNDDDYNYISKKHRRAMKNEINELAEITKIREKEEIGEGNKKCCNCAEIKPECKFRSKRSKCRDCERDNPVEKFKRTVRSRIYSALNGKKTKNTIVYLGCKKDDYLHWILSNNEKYTLENRGTDWHIDHVIPLSHFDLDDEDEQLIAFNWRNTMPLTPKENLSKNNRLNSMQLEEHLEKLNSYHKEKNIEMPQEFIDLFAKCLVVRETP